MSVGPTQLINDRRKIRAIKFMSFVSMDYEQNSNARETNCKLRRLPNSSELADHAVRRADSIVRDAYDAEFPVKGEGNAWFWQGGYLVFNDPRPERIISRQPGILNERLHPLAARLAPTRDYY